MDINRVNFWAQLVPILQSISNATFVAIDLEMSGIPARSYGSHARSDLNGKPSLQQIYDQTREAAEKYQVLQIGITCIEEDPKRGLYLARPYNFNVSPLLMHGDRLEIKRDFTFQSSAVHFLLENGFDIGVVFTKGIPYLSSEEESTSRMNHTVKQKRLANIPDVVISSEDVEMTQFYESARKTLWEFSNPELKGMEFVNIGHRKGLNGRMRRLVHQLVRNEFPAYRASARNRGEFMQVEKLDPVREARFEKSKLALYQSSLFRQIGLRYIFEALSGGELNGIEPEWFGVNESNEPIFCDAEALEQTIQSLRDTLKIKTTVLVGHNLFIDLIFLYKTFVGKLPDQVTEFSKRINTMFPKIFDTKYLATQAGSSMQYKSSLKELYDQTRAQHHPFIVLDEKHVSYGTNKASKEHEAGYDSWMTAQIFVKLSGCLSRDRGFFSNFRIGNDSPRLSRTARRALLAGKRERLREEAEKKPTSRTSSFRKGRHTLQQKAGAAFADINIFALLQVEGQNNSDSSRSTSPSSSANAAPTVSNGASDQEANILDTLSRHETQPTTTLGPSDLSRNEMQANERIPDTHSSFWDLYANYLRVYGTDSEFCYLGIEVQIDVK